MMKKNSILNCLMCLILCGCITEYIVPNIDGLSDILVVEGIITEDETLIMLSRSMYLTNSDPLRGAVDNARIFVECDNGTQWVGEYIGMTNEYHQRYLYRINTDMLNPDNKYRLKIEIDEPDNGFPGSDVSSQMMTYEYCSDFSYPIKTPEIDSIFWVKRGDEQPVMIYVAATSSDREFIYYRWSYKEDWEINSEIPLEGYPYNCWNNKKNDNILLGSTERVVLGKLKDIIIQINPSSRKFSSLYRISIKQNSISKRAYDYFANIKKNSEEMGSIFAPIPSEMRGNIVCTNDPDRPVIGYVDVSTTTYNHRFISWSEVFEPTKSTCEIFFEDSLKVRFNGNIPDEYLVYYIGHPPESPALYVLDRCVDCTFFGVTEKPEDWP